MTVAELTAAMGQQMVIAKKPKQDVDMSAPKITIKSKGISKTIKKDEKCKRSKRQSRF